MEDVPPIETETVRVGEEPAYLAEPAGAVARPGVLLTAPPERAEERDRFAEALAEEGFVVLALPWRGDGAALAAAARWLAEESGTAPGRLGGLALVRGGEGFLAAAELRLRAVVLVSPFWADLAAVLPGACTPVLLLTGEDDPDPPPPGSSLPPDVTWVQLPGTGFGRRGTATETLEIAAHDAFGRAVDFLGAHL